MKAEYNLAKMKSRKNPYARRLKKQTGPRPDRAGQNPHHGEHGGHGEKPNGG